MQCKMFSIILVTLGLAVGSVRSEDGTTRPALKSRVDFAYAFATPHRMTVGRPDNSDRTLLDAEPASLRMAWTYENLVGDPLMAYMPKSAKWSVRMLPQIEGRSFPRSTWTRSEGYLPVLDNLHEDPQGSMRFEVTGAASAAVVRITLTNAATTDLRFSLLCESQQGFFGYNPGYVDPDADRDCLLTGWGDRADRVLVLGLGADEYPVSTEVATSASVRASLTWKLRPGEKRTAWLIRPYRAYAADLPALRKHDWEREVAEAKQEWRELLGRAARVHIPDPGVVNGFYSCLGDLFIMREPVAKGYVAAVPGTEGYRAPNSGEAAIVAVALDQVGLHNLAAAGFQMCLDQQGDDGNWADPQGWCHLMWCIPGFKSWAAMEHYRLSGDRDYLAGIFPRMAASSRWLERQRARTRVDKDGKRPLTYGLMPRGMGDCGLKDDDCLYGVFLPHNIWSVYADRLSAEAAEILARTSDAAELRKIHETALADLRQTLDRGAITEKEYRWIPGVPGKPCGSRWGALNALFPCGILPADHELISGTIRHIRSRLSPGGLPLNTGWLVEGMWVAIALDNLAEAHLVRNEGDAAADLLYATLNHATPLYTWCEERGPLPGAKEITGDRQHLWTPVAVVRAIRDCLVMEDGNALHLARGTPRDWLAGGQPVGIAGAATHFGPIAYEVQYTQATGKLTGRIDFPQRSTPQSVTLHVRLPGALRVKSVNPESGAGVTPDGTALQWQNPAGKKSIEATIQ
jgi:hypothetical protein